MDSVAYRLMPATVAQVVEQYSFQFYLFSLIVSVPFAIILKFFFVPWQLYSPNATIYYKKFFKR